MLSDAPMNMLAKSLANMLVTSLKNILAEGLMNILAESLMNIQVVGVAVEGGIENEHWLYFRMSLKENIG